MYDLLANESYWDLLKSAPHWMFEGTTDLIFAGIGGLFTRWWVKRHDEKHHSNDMPLRPLR